MKPEDINSWGERITKYEADLIQPVIGQETRSLGRQLVYFSFLTFLLAGKFIDTSGGIVGLKFRPEIFPIATFIAGLCCIYLLLNFIFYSIVDYRKRKTHLRKINNENNSAITTFLSISKDHEQETWNMIRKNSDLMKLIDKKREELGLDSLPVFDPKTSDPIEFLGTLDNNNLKMDEFTLFFNQIENQINEARTENKNKATLLEIAEKNLIDTQRRSSITTNLSIFVDIFFPLFLSILAIFLTIYKTYLLFEITSFSKVLDQILAP